MELVNVKHSKIHMYAIQGKMFRDLSRWTSVRTLRRHLCHCRGDGKICAVTSTYAS